MYTGMYVPNSPGRKRVQVTVAANDGKTRTFSTWMYDGLLSDAFRRVWKRTHKECPNDGFCHVISWGKLGYTEILP